MLLHLRNLAIDALFIAVMAIVVIAMPAVFFALMAMTVGWL